MRGFAELAAISNFSFLHGASHPQEMVETAAAFGYRAIGLADRNTLAGVVRGHAAAKQAGLRYLPGARLVTQCGFEVIAYPRSRAAYGALSQCLTQANRRGRKGECLLSMDDVLGLARHAALCWLAVPPLRAEPVFGEKLAQLAAATRQVYALLVPLYGADDKTRLRDIAAMADWAGAALLASFDPLYHAPSSKTFLNDVGASVNNTLSCGLLGPEIVGATVDISSGIVSVKAISLLAHKPCSFA